MSTNKKVSKREVNRWVKWLKGQGYTGPLVGIKPSFPLVKLLAKELKKVPPTILETHPRDPRTIVSNLARFRVSKDKTRDIDQLNGILNTDNLLHYKYLTDHYARLCRLLESLNNQLLVPDLVSSFPAALESRTRIPYRYAGIEPMIYDNGAIKLEVEDSDPFLWKCFEQHLVAELPDFDQSLNSWKTEIVGIVEGSHHTAKIIADRLSKMGWNATEPDLSADSKHYLPGVHCKILTDLLYECVLTNHAPQFQRVPGSRDLVLLMECPSRRKVIAHGDNGLLNEIEEWCLGIAHSASLRKRVRAVRRAILDLEANQKTLKERLRVILERGTFKGVCLICSDLKT